MLTVRVTTHPAGSTYDQPYDFRVFDTKEQAREYVAGLMEKGGPLEISPIRSTPALDEFIDTGGVIWAWLKDWPQPNQEHSAAAEYDDTDTDKATRAAKLIAKVWHAIDTPSIHGKGRWGIMETGGGCYALACQHDGDDGYILVTHDNGADTPNVGDTSALVGFYDAEHESTDQWRIRRAIY